MPHGAAQVGGSEVLLLGVAAFVVALVSVGLAFGLWVLYKRARSRSAHKNQHILNPPPRSSISDPGSLELGNSFRKDDGNEHESYVLLPHNLASYLPSTPPRARILASSPLTPPGLPPCKWSDSAKTPVLVITSAPRSHQSVEILFEHTGTSLSARQVQPQDPVVSEFEQVTENRTIDADLAQRPGSRQRLSNNGDGGTLNETIYSGSEPTSLPQDYAKRMTLDTIRSAQFSPASMLPSPPETPVLPTLVITSPSILRSSLFEENSADFFPSPPKTPTLVLTSPSIHCGINLDQEERPEDRNDDLQNWSEILELENYDDEANAPSESSPEILKQLETPPSTPTLLQSPVSCSSVCLSIEHSLASQPDRDSSEGVQTGDVEDSKPLDYATFHARLVAFNLNHKRAKVKGRFAAEELSSGSSVPSFSFQDTGFNYGRLLARRRGETMSSNSHPSNWPSVRIQVPPPVKSVARRRPIARPGYI